MQKIKEKILQFIKHCTKMCTLSFMSLKETNSFYFYFRNHAAPMNTLKIFNEGKKNTTLMPIEPLKMFLHSKNKNVYIS